MKNAWVSKSVLIGDGSGNGDGGGRNWDDDMGKPDVVDPGGGSGYTLAWSRAVLCCGGFDAILGGRLGVAPEDDGLRNWNEDRAST